MTARVLGAFIAAAVFICGVYALPAHRLYFQGQAYAEFFGRLPATLMFIVPSAIVAFALAAVRTMLGARRTAWLGAALAALLFAFMCVPAFCLALGWERLFATRGGHFGFELPQMWWPVLLLALLQAGAYVDAMRDGFSMRRFFQAFATLLPAIMSADILVEIFFAWPGIGRSFFSGTEKYPLSYRTAYLLLSAAAILIIRAVAGLLPTHDEANVQVFEPL